MRTWTLVLKDSKMPFDNGDRLLVYVERELQKVIADSSLRKLEIRDPNGVLYDLSIDLSLKSTG